MPKGYVIPLTWRNRVLVVGGGVALWALPWLAWPHAATVFVKPMPPKTVFRYVKTSAPGLSGDTWSAVLTSLPTPFGFSRKAVAGAVSGRGPVSVWKSRVSEPMYLDVAASAGPSLVSGEMSTLRPREFDPEGAVVPVFRTAATTKAGTRVEFLGELGNRNYDAPALKSVALPLGDVQSQTVIAYVELDPKGFVHHVLLEQSCGMPAVDAAFVRALRAGAGSPGAGSASGRVRLTSWKSEQTE